MKKFWNLSKFPLIVALIAALLYIFDALLGGLIVSGASFLWVAFIFWTLFFNVSFKERVKAFIGTIIGFLAAILMMLITSSFSVNFYNFSLSTLIGIFVVNLLVMYLDKADKIWLNSISGVFVGISMVFSGLGVGLSPMNGVNEAFIMFGTILLYAVLGLLAGLVCKIFQSKFLNRSQKVENKQKNED